MENETYLDSFGGQMESNYPLITGAITCYNAEDSIAEAIQSALDQDWPNLEIIVVDDHSTDSSVEIVNALAKKDSRIRLIRHRRNLGVGASRNSLLKDARGEFVAFFDDDDYSVSYRISEQYQRIIEFEKTLDNFLVICFSARDQVFADGRIRYEPTLGTDKPPGPSGEHMVDLILAGRPIQGENGSCATCSMMARRLVFERVGGFDTELRRGEDTDFNLRFAMLGGQFAGIAQPLVLQRITQTADKRIGEEYRNAMHRIGKFEDYLKEKRIYRFVVAWTTMKFDYLTGSFLLATFAFFRLGIQFPRMLLQRVYWSLINRSSR